VSDRLFRALSDNWALKLAALVLALLLWAAVRADTPKVATFRNVTVQVDLRDPDWRLADEPDPPSIHVTVMGSTGDLMTLAGQPPRIILPVDRVTDEVETQVIPLQWIQLPRGLRQTTRVVALRPDTIQLRYERLASRTLPVRVRLAGELPDGYVFSAPVTTNPSFVDVRGPARLVALLDSVPLMPVDISGLRSTTNVPTRVDSTALGSVRAVPGEVNVSLRVAPVMNNQDGEGPADNPPQGRRGAPF
jgi:hypothetical protein